MCSMRNQKLRTVRSSGDLRTMYVITTRYGSFWTGSSFGSEFPEARKLKNFRDALKELRKANNTGLAGPCVMVVNYGMENEETLDVTGAYTHDSNVRQFKG